ncbi:hypothetical protein M426DRAFT_264340 [Hypoxylon sp. CI-4A]|nr:hypothetical protein M426DRAFT_264340 [Hypoxylon sp. CI-4A]
MLVRDLRRLALLLIPLLLLVYSFFRCLPGWSTNQYLEIESWIEHKFSPDSNLLEQEQAVTSYRIDELPINSESSSAGITDTSPSPSHNHDGDEGSVSLFSLGPNPSDTHIELSSVSNPGGKYFSIRFGDKLAFNPNIIPHPLLDNTWTIVAQQYNELVTLAVQFVEIACDAVFNEQSSELACVFPPIQLPIAPTGPGNCRGDLEYASLNTGPHDARVFYGPRTPFTIYGSNSQQMCFGQWIQDFGVLINWQGIRGTGDEDEEKPEQKSNIFQLGTELQRPPPISSMEKNWFIFWDLDDQMYAHYDIYPRRVFSKLDAHGTAGPDLAPLAAASGDKQCMAKYMPTPGPQHESIHQASNALSITLCRRSDADCTPNGTNTFLFTIFQHKTYHNFHSLYEPYVMLFRQQAPFEIHGISQKPLWIRGRDAEERMFYVTSVSWKGGRQTYHGYVDDVVFVGFGIEDRESGGIDVLASDLLRGLGICAEG